MFKTAQENNFVPLCLLAQPAQHILMGISEQAGGAASKHHCHALSSTQTQQGANNVFDRRYISPPLPSLLCQPPLILCITFRQLDTWRTRTH